MKGPGCLARALLAAQALMLSWPAASQGAANECAGDPLTDAGTGGPRYAFVAVKEPALQDKPGFLGQALPDPPEFLEAGLLYRENVDGYSLIKTVNGDRCGWLRNEDLLRRTIPLRDEDNQSPAFLKVVIFNRLQDGDPLRIAIRDGPGPEYDVVGQVNAFQHRFLYGLRKSSGGEDYYLVGMDQYVNAGAPWQVLRGWVEAGDATIWASRVAAYFDEDTRQKRRANRQPILFFKDEQAARLYKETEEISRDVVLDEEDFSSDVVLRHFSPRFPVLDQARGLMKLAYVGEAYNTETKTRVGATVVAEKVQMCNQWLSAAMRLDILFVIDATQSMGPYFRATAEAVKAFVRGLGREEEKARVRFAVAIYRDYADRDEAFKVLADFGTPVEVLARRLSPELARSSPQDTDYPEAVYMGLVQGIGSVAWGQHANAVVLIGDHNNRGNDTRFTKDNVVDRLEKRNSGFIGIAIHTKPGTERYTDALARQMRTILERNGEVGGVVVVDWRKASPDATQPDERERQRAVQEKVKAELRDWLGFSGKLTRVIRDICEQGGTAIEQLVARYGIQPVSYALRLAKSRGIRIEEVDRSKLQQSVREGWVLTVSPAGMRQFKPSILIMRTDLSSLVAMFGKITVQMERGGGAKDIANALTRLVEDLTGDKMAPDETVGDFLQRQYHIPFREMSSILDKTPAQLGLLLARGKDNPERKEFEKRFYKSWRQLDLAHSEKSTVVAWDEGSRRWDAVSKKETTLWWMSEAGIRYGWVPLEFFP